MFKELIKTLEMHNYGVRAYENFSQMCHQSAKKHPDHAAFFLCLALLADRFVNQYDESPLTISIADAHKDKVLSLIDEMENVLSEDVTLQVKLLNTLALDLMVS
jgi:hypothetical protein